MLTNKSDANVLLSVWMMNDNVMITPDDLIWTDGERERYIYTLLSGEISG